MNPLLTIIEGLYPGWRLRQLPGGYVEAFCKRGNRWRVLVGPDAVDLVLRIDRANQDW